MNHSHQGRKFGRKKGQRRAFIKGLAGNLITRGRISTTDARAKEIRPVVERLITIAKKQNLASLRRLYSKLDKQSANKLYYEVVKKYESRPGGYLRITKTDQKRKRDAAPISVIEFV